MFHQSKNMSETTLKTNDGDYYHTSMESGYSTFNKSTVRRRMISDDNGNISIKKRCINYIPVLHPVGPFRCIWDSIIMIVLLWTCIEIPYSLAFGITVQLGHPMGNISFTVDILLLIDVVLNFFTAYFDRFDHLRLVISHKKIARRYIKSYFFLDLFTSFPFEFMINQNQNIDVRLFGLFRVLRIMRIVKLFRFFRMLKIFNGFMKRFVVREIMLVFKVLKILILMLFISHFNACIWWFVGSISLQNDWASWINQNRYIIIKKQNKYCFSIPYIYVNYVYLLYIYSIKDYSDAPALEQYMASWYWAVVTLFTTGYGDISPRNPLEQFFGSFTILIGTCFFAYFIGVLTSLVTEGDRIKGFEIAKIEEAQAFCDNKRLPQELTRAVLTHVRYHCNYNYVFDNDETVAMLPPYLQMVFTCVLFYIIFNIHNVYVIYIQDIGSYLCEQMSLESLDIFRNINKNVLGQISLKMKSMSCNESYYLFRKNDVSNEFYLQRTGHSQITFNDNNDAEYSVDLFRGDLFGEDSILYPTRRSQGTLSTFFIYITCTLYIDRVTMNIIY